MTIMWKVEHFLGIPELDAEHCRISELIGRLTEADQRPNPLQSRWQMVNELTDELVEHFAHEESMMESSGCPELAKHREAHRTLLTRVRDLASRATLSSVEVRDLLRNWLETHATMDRSYVGHVQAWLDRRLADGGCE